MQTEDATYWIKALELAAHPEGGFFKETYRSSEAVYHDALPSRFSGPRCFSTAIFFLLRLSDISLFHRIKSDETWHFYRGNATHVHVLDKRGLTIYKVGPDISNGEVLQVTIPANTWFGAELDPGGVFDFGLCGCTVSPGFDFDDFEFGSREWLLKDFPSCKDVIERLTKP